MDDVELQCFLKLSKKDEEVREIKKQASRVPELEEELSDAEGDLDLADAEIK